MRIIRTIFVALQFFSLFSCSEKQYQPYTLLDDYTATSNQWDFHILDSKTKDQYQTYRKFDSLSKNFKNNLTKLAGLKNEDGREIPFNSNTSHGTLVAVKDSMAYLIFPDSIDGLQLMKTVQYKIGNNSISAVDSMSQNVERFEAGNYYYWKKECERISFRFNSKSFYNDIETEITSLNGLVAKGSLTNNVFSQNGKFRIIQKKCNSIIFDEVISIPLGKGEDRKLGIWISKLLHIEDKIFFTFRIANFARENMRLAWFDLKRKKIKIINYPHWNPLLVLFDGSKKILVSKTIIPSKTDPCYSKRDFDIELCCYNTRSGNLEWKIELKRKDEFSSTLFETYMNQIIKLSEEEIGIIYQRGLKSTGVYNKLPFMIIVNKNGEIKQKFEGKEIGGQLVKQEDGVLRIVGRKSQQYLIRGEIKEGSKYYLLHQFEKGFY